MSSATHLGMSSKHKTGPHISIPVRSITNRHGCTFVAGFDQAVAESNKSALGVRNGGAMVSAQASERALLSNLLARLRVLDADVYVGHNVSAFDLDVLLHRLQFNKVSGAVGNTCDHTMIWPKT